MRILITGATGLIGRAVTDALRKRGDEVVALSRDSDRGSELLGSGVEVHAWRQPTEQPPPAAALRNVQAVVHLLGEPVSQRWTEEAKRAIRDSRVLSTKQLVHAIAELHESERPSVLVSQSATGFYGSTGDEPIDETAAAGSDFLADIVVAWEREAQAASPPVRVVLTRTGVVLSPTGGALAKMLPFFRLGIGGPVGGGRQYVPWIHLDDVVGAVIHCIDDEGASGPVNLSAPHPVTNAELSRALGKALHRPAFLPVPALAVKGLYGEMAQIVLTGHRVFPRELERLGYSFRYGEVQPALEDVLRRR